MCGVGLAATPPLQLAGAPPPLHAAGHAAVPRPLIGRLFHPRWCFHESVAFWIEHTAKFPMGRGAGQSEHRTQHRGITC